MVHGADDADADPAGSLQCMCGRVMLTQRTYLQHKALCIMVQSSSYMQADVQADVHADVQGVAGAGSGHAEHFAGCAAEATGGGAVGSVAAGGQPVTGEFLRKEFLSSLAQARVVQHASRDVVDKVKNEVQVLVRSLHAETVARLQPLVGTEVSVDELVGDLFNVVNGNFGQRDSELASLRSHPAYVKPTCRKLGVDVRGSSGADSETFYAYDSPFEETVEALLAQPRVWKDVKAFAAEVQRRTDNKLWATDTSRAKDHILYDIIDGVGFGQFIMRVQLQPGEMPLVFMLYYDGLEVANGLGQARTTHELACFYWALINVGHKERLQHSNLRLATVCLKRAVSRLSAEVALQHWCDSMDRLKRGVTLRTPDGQCKFRGGTAVLAADTPAANQLVGTKESVGPSTKLICRGCLCAQAEMRQCHSFLASFQGWKRVCAGRRSVFSLRSIDDMKAYVAKVEEVMHGKMTHDDLLQWMQTMGVNRFAAALSRLPYISVLRGAPMDVMHVLFEGIAKQVLGAFSYYACSRWGVDVHDIPAALDAWAVKSGRCRSHYPHLNSSRCAHLREGMAGNRCKPDCDFPGTATQVAHTMLSAKEIFRPLVPAHARKDLVWQAVLLCSKISEVVYRRHFTMDNLAELDKTIWLHDTVWLNSPDLQHLWKPKNHYLSHLPLDILYWGPPRSWWCEPFEHENQYVKGDASHSNYANVLHSVAEGKALRCVLAAEQGA